MHSLTKNSPITKTIHTGGIVMNINAVKKQDF